MTYQSSDSSSKDCHSQPQSRLNQQIRRESTDEGCPVIEESGTVCGEKNTLSIFQEFRQMYDDCLQKLDRSSDGNRTLERLAPFRSLIEDLWEQNAMLVETVEELEQEATCTVTNLQEKLNKSCQKMCEYQEDINSLTTIIRRFCENGVLDSSGLKFNTVCPSNLCGECESSCNTTDCSEFEDSETEPNRNVSLDFNNPTVSLCLKGKKSGYIASKNKLTPGISCKSICRPLGSRPSKNIHSSKASEMESDSDLIDDSFCSGCCYENVAHNISKNFDSYNEAEDFPCNETECQDCLGTINISVNLGSHAASDGKNSCTCGSPCKKNSRGC